MRPVCLPALFVFGLLATACDSAPGPEGSDFNLIVAVGDTLREARVRVPAGLTASQPAHLLIALHGSNDTGPNFKAGSKLDEAGTDDMIIAYPTAAKGNWAEGCNCNIADRLQIDDLGFMSALIDSISTVYNISRERTYAMGFSQGGLFAYRLGCVMGRDFTAVAAVSAPMSKPLSESCSPGTAASVLTLHGREDRVLPWTGSDNGAWSLLSAPETTLFWSHALQCDRPATEETVTSGDARLKSTRYQGCRGGTRVTLLEMPEGEHAWYTRDPDGRDLVMDFFLRR
ncbi:MAG: hypothetical protein JJ896_07370 [Rhodothermales bacterium]|nr:hypothetical protein [Rhodothermales bacterium]MBO6779458.1 hypothetical protein [Rhodothermales bacterium]